MVSNGDSNTSDQYREQEAQLIIGLKFHYGKSLKNLPLDVVVDAMVKAWDSCQTDRSDANQGILDEKPRRIPSQRPKSPES